MWSSYKRAVPRFHFPNQPLLQPSRTAFLLAVLCCNCANLQSVPVSSNPTSSSSAEALLYASTTQQAFKQAQQDFEKLLQLPPQSDGKAVLTALNGLHLQLEALGNLAGLYSQVHPDPELRHQAELVEQEISKLASQLTMAKPLLRLLQAIDSNILLPVEARFTRKQIEDLRREGADLEPAKQQELATLRQQLVELGQNFARNIREDRKTLEISPTKLLGLPEDFVVAHSLQENGKITISTDYPDYIPIMSLAEDEDLRLELYTLFRQRGYPSNEVVLQQLLEKRQALANLLGYPNYAAYATSNKMTRNPERVEQFLEEMQGLTLEPSRRKYNELLALAIAQNPQSNAVGEWQWPFLEEQYKRKHFQLDSQKTRAYFGFHKVKQGLFELSERLFGVHFERIAGAVWHPAVELYQVKEGEKIIGQIYLDLHPRADKYQHAAMFPIRGGNGNDILPQAALICNFPSGEDALLIHSDVTTFFHEFGHLLHHLFGGNQAFVSQSGTNVEWDFVEVPSQLLEEWAFDGQTLRSFATNQAGEPIPTELIDALARSRFAGQGLHLRQQIFYASLSLQLHLQPPKPGALGEAVRAIQNRYSPFAYVPNTYFHLSFGHLEGYSALYYTYMWSLAIARDLLTKFEQQGLNQPAIAAAYRQAILAPGGSVDANEMIRSFLGRDFRIDALNSIIQNKPPAQLDKGKPAGKATGGTSKPKRNKS